MSARRIVKQDVSMPARHSLHRLECGDADEFDTVEWPRLILGNGPPVVRTRPTLPTSDGRLEVGCAGEERRWSCSRRYAASTSSARPAFRVWPASLVSTDGWC